MDMDQIYKYATSNKRNDISYNESVMVHRIYRLILYDVNRTWRLLQLPKPVLKSLFIFS